MAFSGIRNHLGSLAKIGNALSSSVNETLGRVGVGPAMALPIGIEFGTGSLKILQVVAGAAPADPPALVAVACLETPDELVPDHRNRLEFQIDGLPRLIRHGGFKGRRAVCAIPAWQTMCKHVSLQRPEGSPLPQLVSECIAPQFGRDPSTLLHRFIEVPAPDRNNRSEVVISAVPRDLVERLMKGIAEAKLEPVGMHAEFTCVLRTFDHVHRRLADAAQNTLYLDIGASTTKVMISHGKDLAFARVIGTGGRHLDDLLSRQLQCDLAEARRLRLQPDSTFLPAPKAPARELVAAGAPADPSAAAEPERRNGKLPAAPGFSADVSTQPAAVLCPHAGDLSEPIEALTDEVLMCLRYHESQFPGKRVDRAMFVGGEARNRALCQNIARALRMQAQVADPLARVARTGAEPATGVDLKQPQPGWAVALGLCLSPTDL